MGFRNSGDAFVVAASRLGNGVQGRIITMKKIWFIFACVLAGMVLGPLFLWYQATQLPSWYSDRTVAVNALDLRDRASLDQARQTIKTKLETIQPGADGTAAVELTDTEINTLLADGVARVTAGHHLSKAIKQINTTIEQGRLESGAVINLANIPVNDLSESEQSILSQLIATVPGLGERDVYVGVEGTPTVANGQLQLDGISIRVGNLRWSVADVAQRLGVPPESLQQEIDRQLALHQLTINDIQIAGNSIRIRGSVN